MHASLRRMQRRAELDFSDHLELRHLHDHGADAADIARMRAHLERALPVRFADAIRTWSRSPTRPPRRRAGSRARRCA